MLWLAQSGASHAAHDDFWYQPVARGSVPVNEMRAMQLSTVFVCVRVLAETIAQLPLILYRRDPDGRGKVRATEHPLYSLLARRPNSLQTSFEWREMMQGHLALRGNAYSRIGVDHLGRPTELWPMHPDRVRVEYLADRQRLLYIYRPEGLPEQRLLQDEVLHLRGLQSDGFIGLNPIEAQRRTLGLSLSTEAFGERFYQSDTVMGGWVEHPNHFKDEESREKYRDAWRKAIRSGRVPIMEYGMKFHEVGMKMTDAQFLESRKYQALQILQIFRMQPHKAGILDQAKWANIEQQGTEFVTDTMLPWARRWEQRLDEALLSDDERQIYFFEFNFSALLRGDSAARATYNEKGLKTRWLTPNEVREDEGRNPVPWGDEPLPMPNQSLRGGMAEEEDDGRRDRAAELERRNAAVIVAKELNQLRALARRHEGEPLDAAVAAFYQGELLGLLMKALAVPREAAAAYVDDSQQRLVAARANGGWDSLFDEWKAGRADQLLEIIHA